MALGQALGWFAWRVVGFRRSLVLEGLARAFPQKTPAELDSIGLACYRNLGRCFVEMFRIHRMSTSLMQRRIRIEGREILDEALAQGRGVINVTFHYGNWELMGAYVARLGYPLDVIARGQKNRFFNRYVNRIRRANGMQLIPVSDSPKTVVASLRRGRIVSFLADQDAHQVGVFVDFLGRAASTPRGPALYAFKTGAPVVLSFMVPQASGGWKIVFERIERPRTDDREKFIQEMTANYTSRLEEYIRRAPEHWFWPHRRWKTPSPESTLSPRSPVSPP